MQPFKNLLHSPIEYVVDLVMPDNCRARVRDAAVKNTVVCTGVICLLQQHGDQIMKAVKHAGN